MFELEDHEDAEDPKPAISIRRWRRVLWLTAGLTSLIILGASAYVIHTTYRNESAEAARDSQLATDTFARHTLDRVNHVDALLRGARWVYRQTGSLNQTEQYMAGLSYDRSMVENLYLIGPDGTILITHGSSALTHNVADRDYFRFHQSTPEDRLQISDVRLGQMSGKYQFRITRRIDNPDGSFGGVVLAAVDPQSFARYFLDLRMGGENLVSLVGTEDRLVRARIPVPSPDKWEVPIASPMWTALERAPTGAFENRSDIDGIDRFFTYRKVDGLPLVLVIGFSQRDLDSRVAGRLTWLWPVITAATLMYMALALAAAVLRGREELAIANRALRHLALFDPLTGLPRRTLFSDRLARCLLFAKRNSSPLALMSLDLDDFKEINDSAGHEAGDQVLREAARRMVDTVRTTDTVCRWGGDEFLILMPQCGSRNRLLEVADRLIARVSEPFDIEGGARRISASIGIACFPEEGRTPETLQSAADAAMYRAKQEGKGRVAMAADLPSA